MLEPRRRSISGAGQRKTLVRPASRHAEAARGDALQVGQHGLGQHVEIRRRAARTGKVGDPEHASDPFTNEIPRRTGAEHDFDAPHQRTNFGDVQIGERRTQVAHETCDEPRTVRPFEGDLLVVDDDGTHFRNLI